MNRTSRSALLAALTSAVLAIAGCVTVESSTDRPAPQTRANGRGVDFGGPVATPATNAEVVNSRVVVGVKRLGAVPFAGQLLPVVSPDGRYLATQVGDPVDWDTLLATPAQSVPTRAAIEVYTLTTQTPTRIGLAEPLPPGSLLGRSADDAGFLIERVTPDGARVIEKVNWLTGVRTRISPDNAATVAAHATLTQRDPDRATVPGGLVLWSSRAVENANAGITSSLGDTRRESSVTFHLPTTDAWPSEFHVVRADPALDATGAASTLVGFRLDATGTDLRARVARRIPLGPRADPVIAFQALGSLQTPAPVAVTRPAPDRDARTVRSEPPLGLRPPAFMFFHPTRSRMVLADRFTGATVPLEEGSSAGAWHAAITPDGRVRWGVFVTTDEGLRYQAIDGVEDTRTPIRVLRGASVLPESYVPRATTDPEWPWLLIGPNKRDPLKLDILRMRLVDAP